MKIGLISIYTGVQSRGIVATGKMLVTALVDEREDDKLGIVSKRFVDPKRAIPQHPSSPHSNFYQPIRTRPFQKLLETLNPSNEQNFVDIGSGTGKALVLAAKYGFQKVVGIEFVPELCEAARENCRRYCQTPFEILEQDAIEYKIQEDDRFFLLNDPWDNVLMEKFVDHVLESYQKIPRRLTVVYKNNNNRYMAALARLGTRADYEFSGNFFEVYSLDA